MSYKTIKLCERNRKMLNDSRGVLSGRTLQYDWPRPVKSHSRHSHRYHRPPRTAASYSCLAVVLKAKALCSLFVVWLQCECFHEERERRCYNFFVVHSQNSDSSRKTHVKILIQRVTRGKIADTSETDPRTHTERRCDNKLAQRVAERVAQ